MALSGQLLKAYSYWAIMVTAYLRSLHFFVKLYYILLTIDFASQILQTGMSVQSLSIGGMTVQSLSVCVPCLLPNFFNDELKKMSLLKSQCNEKNFFKATLQLLRSFT